MHQASIGAQHMRTSAYKWTDGSGRATTWIGATSNPIGVLIHHPSVQEDPGLIESIATATRLASVNARLQAEVRARIVELEASRRRIITAGDEEHRRLERRLRDGAERGLEDLAQELQRARWTADDSIAGSIERVAAQLAETLEELRTLAAGLHPREITERGLFGALEALAARIDTDTQVTVNAGRVPTALEAVVYFVCAEALANVDKHASASSASVAVTIADRVVRIDVCDDGVGGANPAAGSGLLNLADRVHALGGTLDIISPHSGGTCLVAELPVGDSGW
jgi:signal transduction histidine kinase